MQKVLLPSVQSKINQIHNRIITLEVKVKFKTDCEKSMQHTIFTCGKCMMRQIHVGNIEIDNKIESHLRKSIQYCQTYIQLLWNIQRMITHLTFSKQKIITFNKKVIFAVINLTLQQNICCESTRYKVIA